MWTKELTNLLISKYKKYEHLYDKQNPEYANKKQRAISLKHITMDLAEMNPKITVDEVKSKMHTLRSQYLKELREIEKSGTGTNDLYEPKLWCFNKLEFLRPHCTQRIEQTTFIKQKYQVEDEIKNVPQKDKHSIFGEYVASELRSLDISPDLQFRLKNSIQRSIMDINSEQEFRLYGVNNKHPRKLVVQKSKR